MSRAIAWVVMTLGALLVAAAPVLFIAAIWTVGPNSARLAGTAVVVLFVGGFLGLFASFALDQENPR